MIISNLIYRNLVIEEFETRPGQAWCILGSNRSGIDTFFDLISGEIPPEKISSHLKGQACRISLPDNPGAVSFRGQQEIFEEELAKDDTDFMDKIDPGTLAADFLRDPAAHRDLIRAFAMEEALAKGYRQLSTGQSRKLMLLAQITGGVSSLAVQAPYDGLDRQGCAELDKALALCHNKGIQIIITVHNPGDIPEWCTHIGIIQGRGLACAGPREMIMEKKLNNLDRPGPDFKASLEEVLLGNDPGKSHGSPDDSQELICLKKGEAGYGGSPVFQNMDLRIRTGDHTLISGPNGCGKSTLLQVITGDHPACYSNDLKLFGIQRGSGESIWELKQQMGIVSPDLHRNYHVPGNALDCIISGLFDSIGLYRQCSPKEREKALKWLDRIDLSEKGSTPFRSLSFADQRLVLIARALIKLPRLLILDEPTQGLDQANREAVLDFLEQAAKENCFTLLYVSHRRDEFRPFFSSHIRMGQS